MEVIKMLEGKRWFIWALVVVVFGLGALATYVTFVSNTDNLLTSTDTIEHRVKPTGLVNGAKVVFQGKVASITKGMPDTGGVFKVDTATSGAMQVQIPGNIICQSKNVANVQTGQTVQVQGIYNSGTVNVCGSSTDYVKVVPANSPAPACPTNATCLPVGSNPTNGGATILKNEFWGNGQLQLYIQDTNTSVNFTCGNGSIDQPFTVDANGNFSFTGPYSPGPVTMDNGLTATYFGSVKGTNMIFNVKSGGSTQTYNLIKEKALAPMVRCM